MKFLIVDTYYSAFLRWFYEKHPELASRPYSEQFRRLMDECFGTADFYSTNLNKLGHEAHEVIANNEVLQRQWAIEHGFSVPAVKPPRIPEVVRSVARRAQYVGTLASWGKSLVRRRSPSHSCRLHWWEKVLLRQIDHFKPDVLLVQEISSLGSSFYDEARQRVRLMIGQYGILPRAGANIPPYELILSCHPGFVEHCRSLGARAEYLRLGFEASVLERMPETDNLSHALTFIGACGNVHLARKVLLETIARKYPLQWWGYGCDSLDKESPLRPCFRGPVWGLQMYQRLAQSRITLNIHIDQAGPYAANMRLFETTGVGTLLITDWKVNLHDMFEPGKEVVAYRSPEECAESVQYYLEHDEERTAIARTGQQRTLREHTYYHRMQELVDILECHLSYPERAARVVSVPGCLGQVARVPQKKGREADGQTD